MGKIPEKCEKNNEKSMKLMSSIFFLVSIIIGTSKETKYAPKRFNQALRSAKTHGKSDAVAASTKRKRVDKIIAFINLLVNIKDAGQAKRDKRPCLFSARYAIMFPIHFILARIVR